MARTKAERTLQRGRRANELAAIAQCMDGFLRTENDRLEEELAIAQGYIQQLETAVEIAVGKITRRNDRIADLEANWEDMANTLTDALGELERYRTINQRLTEQVLDCTCKESEFEIENLE